MQEGLLRPRACTLVRTGRVLTACMRCHVQAEPSNSADKKQEGYRRYMLQRLLPAMFMDCDMAIDYASTHDMLAVAPLRMELVAQRLEKCPTAQLDAHLETFYDRLLMVRTAFVVRRVWGTWK